MDAYAGKRSVDVSAIRFLYDGSRLDGSSTPGKLLALSPLENLIHLAVGLLLLVCSKGTVLTACSFTGDQGMEDNDVIDCVLEQIGGH